MDVPYTTVEGRMAAITMKTEESFIFAVLNCWRKARV